MTLHPDILDDLLVVFHAGEASEATRTLLEQRAVEDSAFARRLRSADGGAAAPLDVRIPDAQRKALSSIGHWNRLYSLFVGLAGWMALFPFTFAMHNGEVTFFLLRDSPGLTYASLSLSIASAIAAWRFRTLRRLD